MELKEYLKIFKKNLLFIIILTVLCAFIAFFSTKFLKSGYINDQTYFLKITSLDDSALNQKPDPSNITDTAVAVLTSADFLSSNEALSEISLDAKKMAPQVIKLTVTTKNSQSSKNAQTIVVNDFNQKLANFIPDNSVQLESLGTQKESYQQILNSKVLGVFGALVGFLTSLIIIALRKYLKL